jgi:flagellar biosynthesis protein FliQ
MTDSDVVHVGLQAMLISAKLAMPILLVSLAIGFGIGLIQAVTQVQEVTLSFVPKLIGVALVILVSGNWMLHEVVAFTRSLFALLPRFLDG